MRFKEIMDQLSCKYELRILSDAGSDNLLDLAFLDDRTRLFPETWLFFGYDDQLPKDLPRNLVLISDLPKGAGKDMISGIEDRSIALISRTCAGAFFNDVRLLIEKNRHSGYYDAVIEAMDQIRDIPAFIDMASLSFGASLILCDIEYRILAWSTTVPVTDPIWKKNIERGFCDYEFIKKVRNLKTVRSMGRSREIMEVNCSRSPSRKYAGMVFVHGEPMGFILLIESEDSFRETHPQMLASLSGALGFGIPRYAPSWVCRRTSLQRLLYNLLIGADLSDFPEAIRDLPDPGPYRVLCIRKEDKSDNAVDPALGNAVEKVLPEPVVVLHRNAFYVMLREPDAGKALEEKVFEVFLRENCLILGTGPVFKGIGDYTGACSLAHEVLKTGNSRINIFEQRLPQIMTRVLARQTNPSFFVHPAIQALEKSDMEKGTHLLQTLSVFLEKGENIGDTAKALFLHRNSVIYRLNRIREISGADLTDPGTRFILRLGLAVREE